MKKVFCWILCSYFCIGCYGLKAKEISDTNTSVDIFSSITKAAPMQPFSVLIKMTPKNNWHIYWNNPGDTGVETKINVKSDEAKIKLVKQSAPNRFLVQNIITQFAYDNDAYWLFEIIPNSNDKKSLNLTFDISWQECRDECVAVSVTKSLRLPVVNNTENNPLWENELFKAQKTFPISYKNANFKVKDSNLIINIPDSTKKNITLFPELKDVFVYDKEPIIQYHDRNLIIKQEVWTDAIIPENFNLIIRNNDEILQFNLVKSDNVIDINNPLWGILIAAFCGGLLLNLMPCIFPILFIKAMNLIQNTYSYKKASSEALMYFSGVLFSFSILALLLYMLRLSGENVGWGFQLQSPYFIGFMFVLFFIIGLMFLGVINFNISFFNNLATAKVKNNNINSFLTGLFAVLIASPCSAPFMGAAIGYSITQPLYIYFPVFLSLAIGYALPFTVIGLFPKIMLSILPKPGKWMLVLKKLFAIPVFATCIWLAWIFVNQVNITTAKNSTSTLQWNEFYEYKNNYPENTLIVFTAKWCLTCVVNEKLLFDTDKFKEFALKNKLHLIKADWTNKSELITKELAKYNRNSVPLYVYYKNKQSEPIILPQILTLNELEKQVN